MTGDIGFTQEERWTRGRWSVPRSRQARPHCYWLSVRLCTCHFESRPLSCTASFQIREMIEAGPANQGTSRSTASRNFLFELAHHGHLHDDRSNKCCQNTPQTAQESLLTTKIARFVSVLGIANMLLSGELQRGRCLSPFACLPIGTLCKSGQ